MNKLFSTVVGASLLAGAMLSAGAASAESTCFMDAGKVYIGIGANYNVLNPLSFSGNYATYTGANPLDTATSVDSFDKSYKNPGGFGYKAHIGYKATKNIGVNLGVSYAPKINSDMNFYAIHQVLKGGANNTLLNSAALSKAVALKTSNLAVDLSLQYDFVNDTFVTPYVMVRGGYLNVQNQFTLNNNAIADAQKGATNPTNTKTLSFVGGTTSSTSNGSVLKPKSSNAFTFGGGVGFLVKLSDVGTFLNLMYAIDYQPVMTVENFKLQGIDTAASPNINGVSVSDYKSTKTFKQQTGLSLVQAF